MNKKVLTLCAGLLLAGSATAWGQVIIPADITSGNGAYTVQKDSYAEFNQFVRDDASSRTDSRFPAVSPFAIKTAYGAKPISELQHTDGTSDGRYFQFVVGDIPGLDGMNDKNKGTDILTMVWVDTKGELTDDDRFKDDKSSSVAGHYEIQIENVHNANVPNNRIALDRTLWKVTAHKDQVGGTTLYYELQNKGSQMLLQLGRDNIVRKAGETAKYEGRSIEAYEIGLTVVSGQTNWRWAEAEKSAVYSDIETDLKVLKNTMSAQYDNNMTVHLARKVTKVGSGDEVITLGAIRMNSSLDFKDVDDVVTITYANADDETVEEKYYPISFEGWEANPIILTAAQINAELGNEVLATEDQKTPNQFHFEFDNDVQGDVNVMTQYNFEAVGPTGAAGNIADNSNYLRVDTTYHDPSVNGQYHLKMAVDKVLYPRDAVLYEGNTIDNNGNLAGLSTTDIYGNGNGTTYSSSNTNGTKAPYSARAYVQLKRQTNFRPIFYPATQSLRLQAEMVYKADKRSNEPWWMQMAEDAMAGSNSNPVKSNVYNPSATGVYMRIAGIANDPLLDTRTNPEDVRGYYPSYAQVITATTNGTFNVEQNLRLIHYRNPWQETSLPDKDKRNGYAAHGTWDWDDRDFSAGTTTNKMVWNAVGNVMNNNGTAGDALEEWGMTANLNNSTTPVNVWVKDPAASSTNKTRLAYLSENNANRVVTWNGSSEDDLASEDVAQAVVFAPQFATAHSNLVRIETLTTGHRVLTAAVHDYTDATLAYNGLNTFITLQSVKTEPDLEEVANIPEGFYYIINAKNQNSDLVKAGDYRYEDLAATNATFTYWNAYTKKWDRGHRDGNASAIANNNNNGMDTDIHAVDKSNIGNLVYSEDKKVIPSAQWYIKGNGGYYTIINRESGRVWGTSYWWKVRGQEGVYANEATLYDGSGLQQTYRDTIRIEAIPAAELNDPHMGYLWLTQEEAVADTVNFNMGMNFADISFSVVEGEDGVLRLSQEEGAKGDYKLERVLLTDKDIASQDRIPTDDFIYGYLPENTDTTGVNVLLTRAKYHIYKDDVSANTGDEETSIVTRKYITLNAGKYQLTPVKVEMNDDGYTVNTEVDELANTEGVKVRRQFYIKQISTEEPNQFVLVDPYVVSQTRNGNFTKEAYGARAFVNQNTTELQPSSLISDGYSNAYAASIFNVEKKQAYNYADIRPAGVDRDTIAIYSAYTGSDYLLSENANGLLESLDSRLNKNNALFLDTANISRPECPRFLIGLRSKDSVEISNLDHHNVHLFTDADYLINMVDSAENNKDYIYQNQPFNSTKYYRLGFVRARHHADGTLEFLNEENRTYDLTNKTLENANDLNIATFAFRYANANRDEDALYYIETMYDQKGTRGWLKTINHVQVVTNDIQEADRYGIDYEVEGAPTANEAITAEGAVSVVATDGAVVIKGAEGKNVVIATILGKVVANETVNSDNETIAVPAGIAVVSVDGESFKVVVK